MFLSSAPIGVLKVIHNFFDSVITTLGDWLKKLMSRHPVNLNQTHHDWLNEVFAYFTLFGVLVHCDWLECLFTLYLIDNHSVIVANHILARSCEV